MSQANTKVENGEAKKTTGKRKVTFKTKIK